MTSKVMSSTAPTQPVIVRPRVARRAQPPKADLTQAFQTMMPYVIVALISLLAYSAYNKAPSALPSQMTPVPSTPFDQTPAPVWPGATEHKIDNLKEKLSDFKDNAESKFADLKKMAEEKIIDAQEKIIDLKDSTADKLGEKIEEAKAKFLGVDEIPFADSAATWYPNDFAPITQKVSDFLLRALNGDIEERTIIRYFGIPNWRSMSADERNDTLLQQMHRFGPRAVEFLVDGITSDYATNAKMDM